MSFGFIAIHISGKLVHADLDERALDALKEFGVDAALNVLKQFTDSNLEHVSNKSAFLCGVMKTYRQKSKAQGKSACSLFHLFYSLPAWQISMLWQVECGEARVSSYGSF